jgi:hypothetical protein
MHSESYQETREEMPDGVMSAQAVLEAMQERAMRVRYYRPKPVPEGFAMRGLLLILPISLALWCAIGLAVWAWVR